MHGMKSLLLSCALPILLTAQVALGQATAPKVKAASRSLKPAVLNGIRETRLPNGLTVLTKEARSAPVVYFSVWFKVGSANEQLGQSGMSHLLEHMLFKGTKTRKPGEISALLQENGADFNATTWFDRTNYFATLASDRLEMVMQLEADRMQNSLFDPAQHQKEMTVVRSEYEGGENNPGSALTKAVRLAAYQVHPYRWTTIGFRADIENISRDEMFAYYKRHYVPNNATIVMVGDFNTAAALALVRKYFGSMSPKPLPKRFITPEPEQQGERRVVVRRAGSTRLVQIAYHIPEFGHRDRYALDVLEGVLSGGRTSRFFERLIQTGLASSADAYDYGLRDPDLLFSTPQLSPARPTRNWKRRCWMKSRSCRARPFQAPSCSACSARPRRSTSTARTRCSRRASSWAKTPCAATGATARPICRTSAASRPPMCSAWRASTWSSATAPSATSSPHRIPSLPPPRLPPARPGQQLKASLKSSLAFLLLAQLRAQRPLLRLRLREAGLRASCWTMG
jgi:predicted Zn-dependent peptidase